MIYQTREALGAGSRLLVGITAAFLILPVTQGLAQSRSVDAVGPNGGTVEKTLVIEDGEAVREVSRKGPQGGASDKLLIIREGTIERDVTRTGPNGGSQDISATINTSDGTVVRTSDGSLKTYTYENGAERRKDRRRDRQDFRQDRRDSRQDFREDRRENRQDRRSDRRDRRDDRRDRRGG